MRGVFSFAAKPWWAAKKPFWSLFRRSSDTRFSTLHGFIHTAPRKKPSQPGTYKIDNLNCANSVFRGGFETTIVSIKKPRGIRNDSGANLILV